MNSLNIVISAGDAGWIPRGNLPLDSKLVPPNDVSASNTYQIIPVFANSCSAIVTDVTMTDQYITSTSNKPLFTKATLTTLPAWISNVGKSCYIYLSAINGEGDNTRHIATITYTFSSVFLSGCTLTGSHATTSVSVSWSTTNPTSSFIVTMTAVNLPYGTDNAFICQAEHQRLYELEYI